MTALNSGLFITDRTGLLVSFVNLGDAGFGSGLRNRVSTPREKLIVRARRGNCGKFAFVWELEKIALSGESEIASSPSPRISTATRLVHDSRRMPYVRDGAVVTRRTPWRLSIVTDVFWTVVNLVAALYVPRSEAKVFSVRSRGQRFCH